MIYVITAAASALAIVAVWVVARQQAMLDRANAITNELVKTIAKLGAVIDGNTEQQRSVSEQFQQNMEQLQEIKSILRGFDSYRG